MRHAYSRILTAFSESPEDETKKVHQSAEPTTVSPESGARRLSVSGIATLSVMCSIVMRYSNDMRQREGGNFPQLIAHPPLISW